MKTLFVQIKCKLGTAYDVAARIVDDLEHGMVYSTSGPFDLMAIFNLDGSVDPGVFVLKNLHSIPGIAETNTILAFNAFTPTGLHGGSAFPAGAEAAAFKPGDR